jgi:subtilisin-like proprotein convertase family protein
LPNTRLFSYKVADVIRPSSTLWFRSLSSIAFVAFLAIAPQVQSQTFAGGAFSIPDTAVVQNQTVAVSGVAGSITAVTVTLNFTSAARPDDTEFLLVAPDGTSNLEFLSDGGGNGAIGATAITLSDSGATCVPDGAGWVSGTTYKPADYSITETGADFGLPALTINRAGSTCAGANGTTTFAVAFGGLSGSNVNGTWHLYARDDTPASGDSGAALSSWSITITAQAATATVGNFVFNDLDGDGIQDAGEPGIDGVTVQLLNSPSLSVAASTVTAGGGLYSFSSVPASNYVIAFATPAGFAFSPKDQGGDDSLDSDANTGTGRTDQFALAGGQNDTTRDCGMTGTYVGNFVFGDSNQNGVQDVGEVGIDGVTVQLLNNLNNVVGTTTTAGGGLYSFFVSPAGTYSVKFVLPSGFTFSPQDQGGDDTKDSDANTVSGQTAQFTVTSGVVDNTRDAGMFASGVGTFGFTSTGVTINDTASGATPYPSTISVGGLGGTISKVTVTVTGFTDPRPDDVDMLLVGPNGASLIVWSDVGGNSPGTATITLDDAAASFLTDTGPLASGTFKPTNESTAQDPFPAPAPAGPYGNPGGAVVGAGPDGFASKYNNSNPNGTWSLYILDDAAGSGGAGSITSWSLNVTTQASTAIVGDRVFEDLNNNGIQNGGEPGVDGITVRLLNSPALTTAATTTTAGGGLYQFSGVAPGNYVVEFVAPAGYSFASKDQGGDDTIDSDANSNGRTDQFSVVAGQIDSSRDAGLVGTFVGDKVFGDLNHNGIQDGGDTGIDGVTVRLRNSSDAIVGVATTAGGGLYRFLVTTPGNYQVEFILPNGYAFSPQDQGGNDNLDSDANTSTGRTALFAVVAGQPDNTRDAGMYATSVGPLTFQSGAVAITDGTTAAPYPSTISVGGRSGTVTKVRVILNGFSEARPDDVDMLLVGPNGASFIILSDVGGNSAVGPVTLTLDDAAGSFLSDAGPLSTGTFKATNESTAQDSFTVPAPAGPYGNPGGTVAGTGPDTFASKFNTTDPNGTWSLYILDDAGNADAGGSMTSWGLEITTTAVAVPPAITSANNTTFTVGSLGTFTVTTTGDLPMTINRTGALPTGVTFVDNGDGTATLSGTPAAGTGGTYPITITASNGTPPDATQSFTLTVKQAPAITSANSATFTVGTLGSFTVTTTGSLPMTIGEAGALPLGVGFVDNGNGTATISGTPSAGTGGTYNLSFTASNGVPPAAVQSFTLTVNQAPAITSANNVTFIFGAADSFTVTTTGKPTPSINRTGALPSGITFTDNGDGTGTLSGTATASGTFPITFTASNGVLPNAVQSFTLTVNKAPTITSANSTTFTVGTLGSFTVTTTGKPTPSINEAGALPLGVGFIDNGDGTATLSGTPDPGTEGTYNLSFTASNGLAPDANQSFTLTVDPAATPVCVAPPADMVSWWPGDGNANDIRGLNDGAFQGTATFAAAEVGQGFSLNGTTDYVEIPDSPSLDITGQITIDAWIQPTVVTGQGRAILSKYDSGAGQFSYNFFINTDGTLIFAVYHGATPEFRLVKTSAALTANVFTHVAATFNPITQAIKIYVNGQDTNAALHPDSSLLPGINASTTPVRIGTYKEGASLVAFFSGLIDEVEVFNRALCADDILAIYNAGSAGKCKPLLSLDFNGNNPGPGFGATQAGFITVDVADANTTGFSAPIAGLDLATAPTGTATLTVQASSLIFSRDRTATPPNSGAFNFHDLYRDLIGVVGGPLNISLAGLAPNTIFDVTFYATDQGVSSSNTATFANTTNGGSVPSGSITYGPPVTSNHQFSVRLQVISNASGVLSFSETSTGPQGGPVINGLQVAPVPTANACPSPTPAALELLNISARASVGTGDNVAIGGFIIEGAGVPLHRGSPSSTATTKRVLIRGLGPSLQVNGTPVVGRLLDPVLELFDDNGSPVASNDNWRVPAQNETDVQATGLAPSNDLEPAIAITLDASANINLYTAILSGSGNTTGIGLVEIYDLEPNIETHLANISTRAQVLTGDDVLIAGIIVSGGDTQKILFRALGPSLTQHGVTGALQNPKLELRDAQGTLIAHNDNWKEEPDGVANGTRQTQINATGLAPQDDSEAAILYVAPPPGNYTAIESGAGGTGVGLVEVYRLGPPSP